MDSAVLKLTEVRAGYRAREVLQGVSLSLEPGRVMAVLGPNGAGKSTLVRVCLGLHAVSSGEVRVAGRPLAQWERRELAKRVAWVPQMPGEAGEFTALELVLMGRAPHLPLLGLPSKGDIDKAQSALAELGIESFAGRRMAALSGGEQRLVLLARALAQEPSILILDEPTAFLDLKHQMDALERVRARASGGMAVLAVLHDVNLASVFADDVLLLRAGSVLASGPRGEVLASERLRELYGLSMHTAEPEPGVQLFFPKASG